MYVCMHVLYAYMYTHTYVCKYDWMYLTQENCIKHVLFKSVLLHEISIRNFIHFSVVEQLLSAEKSCPTDKMQEFHRVIMT